MKKNIIIDPGMLPPDRLVDVFLNAKEKHQITILSELRRKSEFQIFNQRGLFTIFYEDFEIEKNNILNNQTLVIYDKAVLKILNDSRTFLLAERVNKIHYWNSLFNIIPKIEKTIFNFLYFHQSNPIDEILFQATPHNLLNWVLAKTAEIAGIKVKMIQTSPLPWRYWVVEGLDEQIPVFPKSGEVSDIEFLQLEKYIELNQKDYKTALPEYEKKRLDSRKGKYWSWNKEIKDILFHPKKLVSIRSKSKNYRLYNNLAEYTNNNQKNVVFFLHFQPERTSMPEAYHYSNQWLIIKKVATALPEDVVLYIKEHPSVFTNNFDVRYRNETFYKDVSKLRNVQFVPLDCDTFEMIDNAMGIITITGTVGVQALMRKKPVLTFGTASYRKLNNVYDANRELRFLNTLHQLLNSKPLDDIVLNKMFENVMRESVSGIRGNSVDNINFYKAENRVEGHILLLKNFINE